MWLLERLAAEGADVIALLTGRAAPVAAVPLVDRFLAGHTAGATVLGAHHVPAGFVAMGTYAVLFDSASAGATLGGTAADRPRAGDVVVVVTDIATAAGFASGTERPGARRSRKRVPLPPPVVLLDGVPTLSLAHRVRSAGRGVAEAAAEDGPAGRRRPSAWFCHGGTGGGRVRRVPHRAALAVTRGPIAAGSRRLFRDRRTWEFVPRPAFSTRPSRPGPFRRLAAASRRLAAAPSGRRGGFSA